MPIYRKSFEDRNDENGKAEIYITISLTRKLQPRK